MQPEAMPIIEPTRSATVWLILLFWTTQFSLLTMERLAMMPEDNHLPFLIPRLCVTALAVGLSFAMLRLFRHFSGRPIKTRMVVALIAGVSGSVLHAAGNFAIFQIFMPKTNWEQASLPDYLMSITQWFWAYLALAGLLLALSYSFESADRERRIAQLRTIADAAQLRALRYQLNPHFMFNTLNSVAALISRRQVEPAEMMVENLADFLRASLSLDPRDDITLDREIELQALYLAIEAARFSDRLDVRIDIADDARKALVPSLVLQPLIENAVKHAVSTSVAPVTLTIGAKVHAGRLDVSVHNSAGDGLPSKAGGTGVGLANVAERLEARFDEDCAFAAGREPDGGFAVRFSIPFAEAA